MASLLPNPTPPDPTLLPPPNGGTKETADKGMESLVAKEKEGAKGSLPLRVDYTDNIPTWSELLTTVPASTGLYIRWSGPIKEST
jgi:hypothetical protein